ncbi:MAG: formate dehydrogenase accessory protein FdhE [Chloroflexi bacterium]|nr:formate dehydrogenase accessory protein FdhE [Chloroflexota bacterium]
MTLKDIGYSPIASKLDEDERKGGVIPLLLEFYKRLLRIQSETEHLIGTPKIGLTVEAVSERVQTGVPLLTFDELHLDWTLLQETFSNVAAVFTDYAELFGKVPDDAARPLKKEMVRRWFGGLALPCEPASVMEDMIHATLKPFLASYSRTLLPMVNQERWRRGYCPVCGGNPDFALLKGENGARWLVCSRCDAEWLFQRLECPYCGNQDPDSLAYYTDEKMHRLYVCEKCKRYLKAVDTRLAMSGTLLPVERLFSLDIDRQGQELGYNPCGKASA